MTDGDAEPRRSILGRWERLCLSVYFWPVVTVPLVLVWFLLIAVVGGSFGFWGGYGVLVVGLVGALIAKKRVRRRAGGIYWPTSAA